MEKAIYIDYTNWRGERSIRRIIPTKAGLEWASNEYHPEKQWLLVALDVDKDAIRTFAMKDIHRWSAKPIT